jgi:adenylyl cyclase-associated protein
VNVNLPPKDEEGDYSETPVPEQFRSYVKDGKLVTEIVEHAG